MPFTSCDKFSLLNSVA